jgi:hypothetical protein
MKKNLESNKQFIASQESAAREGKQENATSSETIEQQCPILNDAKSGRILSQIQLIK